jgi:hypothetical protein
LIAPDPSMTSLQTIAEAARQRFLRRSRTTTSMRAIS